MRAVARAAAAPHAAQGGAWRTGGGGARRRPARPTALPAQSSGDAMAPAVTEDAIFALG